MRNQDDEQKFSVEFLHGGVRHYRAPERDALLATLLDGVRSSGNRDIHVQSAPSNRALRLTPLWQAPDEEASLFLFVFQILKDSSRFSRIFKDLPALLEGSLHWNLQGYD